MNWIDIVFIGIILLFAIIGLLNGFIMSIFRIASFFISMIAAVTFYPVIADFLMKTFIYKEIKASFLQIIIKQLPSSSQNLKQAAGDTLVRSLAIPDFLKGTILKQMPDPTKLLDMTILLDITSAVFAKIVINILSVIVLFIVIRIVLIFAKFFLEGISKLPLFKQVDKLGGVALGAVEGLLVVYILCAVVVMFQASSQFVGVLDAIQNGTFAKYFYEHNFIIDWIFSRGKRI